jgi:hypothetical protein
MTIKRSTGGLREALFEEMDHLRNGESTPGRARAVAALGNALVGSITAETEAVRHLGQATKIGDLEIGVS